MSDISTRIDEISAIVNDLEKQDDLRFKWIENNNPNTGDCLCFIAMQNNSKVTILAHTDIQIEYSKNGIDWILANDSSSTDISFSKSGELAFVRGNNSRIGMTLFSMTGKIKAVGNIMSLLSIDCEQRVLSNSEFYGLFSGCSALNDVSELVLPSKTVGEQAYGEMFKGTGITSLPIILAEAMSNCDYMFQNCTNLEFVKYPMYENLIVNENFQHNRGMFSGCTGLKYAVIDTSKYKGNLSQSWYMLANSFEGCTGIIAVKVDFAQWYTDRHFTEDWLKNTNSTGILICPDTLDTTERDATHIPSGWTAVQGNDFDTDAKINASSCTSSDVLVSPSNDDAIVINAQNSLTINANSLVDSSCIAYAEVVIDLAANATVTEGTNITFKDIPAGGFRNICVVRWQDGSATLYVVDTIELS